MSNNRATIYSNGIAELQRVYTVDPKESRRISIPVRQQHLADVLGSLTVSGSVSIDSPPSYQPANIDDGNIRIDTSNALLGMAKQLSGADVKLTYGDTTAEGQLVGIHSQEVATAGDSITDQYLVVLSNGQLCRVPMKEISSLEFTDETIQAEINKALNRRLREIKPNSTFVDLVLSAEKQTDAVIQYTIPAAAWKISYRLILRESGKIEFHGHAIVDNNTDEDWKDFIIAVVMGQPITFSSDLADSKTPRRNHINVVQESAIGAVEVEEAMKKPAGYFGSIDGLKEESLMAAAPAPAPRAAMSAAKRSRGRESAKVVASEVTESGDFCIFESAHPVSIDARRSAVIPVFQTALAESKAVLHYKFDNHKGRPFRSIRFKNTTGHSLGRGVCAVFDETSYVGSCIVPSLKDGGDTLLPHALESGVKVKRKSKPTKRRRVSIQVSDGVAIESYHHESLVEYQVVNGTNQELPFVLDHDFEIRDCDFKMFLIRQSQEAVQLSSDELNHGRRVEFDLQAEDNLVISIVESKIETSRIRLAGATQDEDFRIQWLFDNFVDADTSLVDDPKIKACIDLQKKLDEIEQQASHANHEIQRMETRQERLRKNIQAGGGNEETIRRWQTDLGKSEDAIVQLEEERIPELNEQRTEVRRKLFGSLNELALHWSE